MSGDPSVVAHVRGVLVDAFQVGEGGHEDFGKLVRA
jgi:hypothetical protein